MLTYPYLNIIKRAGRFGNNLFQIAALAGIAERNHTDWYIPPWRYMSFFPEVAARVRPMLTPDHTINEQKDYRYQEVEVGPGVTALDGYWQSYMYLERRKAQILFSPEYPFRTPAGDNWVAVHVRRGDYLTRPNIHPVQTTEYYQQAMGEYPGMKYCIFSDNIEWCRDNIPGDRYQCHESDMYDFEFMTTFKHFIIANSSFSWWAAWLSGSDNVIAPRRWSGVTDDLSDLIPPGWRLM